MKTRNDKAQDMTTQTIDPHRRRLLQLMAAGTGTALLASLPWARAAGAAHSQTVHIVVFDNNGQRIGERELAKVVKSVAEWKKQLSPEAYQVTRHAGTERAYSGVYSKPDKAGLYRCICCDTALYDAATQFHSGTGWPSFWQPIAKENVTEHSDSTFGMRRTEITCSRCDAHLGHVFNDGPQPTGLRYCMNSVALRFVAAGAA